MKDNAQSQKLSELLFSLGHLLVESNEALERKRRARVKEHPETADSAGTDAKAELYDEARSLIKAIIKRLPMLKLNDVQARIIAVLFHYTTMEQAWPAYARLMQKARVPAGSELTYLPDLTDLMKKEILTTDEPISRRKRGEKDEFVVDPGFFQNSFMIDDTFFASVMSDDAGAPIEQQPFASLDDYRDMWFDHIERKTKVINQETYGHRRRAPFNISDSSFFELLAKREEATKHAHPELVLPLRALANEKRLDENEQLILMYALHEELNDSRYDVAELVRFISVNRSALRENRRYFGPESRLYRERLLVEMSQSFMGGQQCELNPEIKDRLMDQPGGKQTIHDILHGQKMLEIIKPVHSLEHIVLSDEVRKQLLDACERYDSSVHATLASWGLYDLQEGEPTTAATSKLILLFHGAPGTGKTLASRVLASHLGREIVTTDISKILDAFVGESEKHLKRLFSRYRRCVEQLERPPVLLLNECDQFLSSRSTTTGGRNESVNRMYHQMQNILLEEIESFKGVMIMTTNLIETLDPAFSRRIDLKLEFKRPTERERAQLWRLHLSPKIPGAEAIDVDRLAASFDLTGGQINVIIRNAATAAASRKEEERRLTYDDLATYATLEVQSQFETERRQKRPLGFGAAA